MKTNILGTHYFVVLDSTLEVRLSFPALFKECFFLQKDLKWVTLPNIIQIYASQHHFWRKLLS